MKNFNSVATRWVAQRVATIWRMLFLSRHSKSEKTEIEKAKKQLLVVGVTCVALIIFIIWLTGLDNAFKRNRQKYSAVIDQSAQKQLSNKLQEIKQQLRELR